MPRKKKVIEVAVEAVEAPAHAFASPSKLSAIAVCPYIARNCENWVQPESEAAERGSKLHEAIYNDETLASLPTEDRDIVERLREQFVEPCVAQGMAIDYETKTELKDKEGNVLTWGTIDFLARKDSEAFLIDWKFGSYPVEHFWGNYQLKTYACGAFQAHPELETIHVMIVQPAIGAGFNTIATVGRDSLEDLVAEIASIIDKANKATPEDAVPSAETCRFCNKAGCKAYNEMMAKALGEYNAYALAEAVPQLPTPELVSWCDKQKGEIELLKGMIADREDAVNKVIKDNGGSENYKLTKPAVRKTVDYKGLLNFLHIDEEIIAEFTITRTSEPTLCKRRKK